MILIKINKVIIINLCIVILVLTGCSKTTNSGIGKGENKGEKINNVTEISIYNLELKAANNYSVRTEYFDLGAHEYTSSSNKVMPYRLRGVISLPQEDGKYPLVLITHGSHSNDNEKLRFDDGLLYLTEALAGNGIIAVSMDMSAAYQWKYGDNDDMEKSIHIGIKQLEALLSANNGDKVKYPVSLKDKIDFSNIGLIGHSRGGETIFDIAREFNSMGYPVKCFLSVAPTLLFTREWPGGEAAVIVPEYDGDVMQLDGFHIFERLAAAGKTVSSVTLLKGANHNYFNSKIARNDAEMLRKGEELADQLPRASQEYFLKEFAVQYFKECFGLSKSRVLYDNTSVLPHAINGYPVVPLINSGFQQEVIKVEKDFKGYTANGTDFKYLIDSWFYKDDEVYIDTLTFGDDSYKKRPLYRVSWSEAGQSISFEPENSDFSKHKALDLRVVVDAADENNSAYETQQFTVVLKDAKGNTATVIIPEGLNALKPVKGYLDYTEVFQDKAYYWSRLTPISSLYIPLSYFKGPDLTNISSLSIEFDKRDKGSIYISSLLLQ